jgi:hypothetical protein
MGRGPVPAVSLPGPSDRGCPSRLREASPVWRRADLRSGGCRSAGQTLISLGAPPPVTSILRGLAFSAMGMRRISTPAS